MEKSILKGLGYAVLGAVTVLAVFYGGLKLFGTWNDEWSGYNAGAYISDGYCNIAVLPVMGEIHSYGTLYDDYGNEIVSTSVSATLAFIGQAEADPGILGIMAMIDSTGGTAVAAEMISTELMNSSMPVAAYIAEYGTSAAYLIATGADTVIASGFSDVGSIGVTMSYLDYSTQNAEQGLEFVSLSSGKFKDYGNPDKPITAEERALFERDLAIWHDEFVAQVAKNRNLPLEAVAKLADGSSMPGKLALEAKLVDALGGKEDVRAWFAEQLDMPAQDVVFCQL